MNAENLTRIDDRRRKFLKAALSAAPFCTGGAAMFLQACSKASESASGSSGLLELGVREAAQKIKNGELKAEDYASQLLKQHDSHKDLNALVTIDPARVMEAARLVDIARTRGGRLGPLAGVPFAVKDQIDVAGYPTTGGLARDALRGYIPKKTAPVIDIVLRNGGIMFAKANMSGGVTSSNRYLGFVRNPYDRAHIPGGSSGGCAAAVAARIVPAAIGEDTGGSVRLPAALCGIAGLRPSTSSLENFLNGRNSPATWRKRYSSIGLVPPSSSLTDTLGPMARSVGDIAYIDEVVTGERTIAVDPREARIGIPSAAYWQKDYIDPAVVKVIETALSKLREAGVKLIEYDLDALMRLDAGRGVLDGELGIALSRENSEFEEWLADNIPGLTVAEVMRNVPRGPAIRDARTLTAAQKHQITSAALRQYTGALAANNLTAIAFATVTVPAPLINPNGDTLGQAILVNGNWVDEFETLAANTFWGPRIGAPGISIPAGFASGLPVGLSLQGTPGQDSKLLGLGVAVENILGALPPPERKWGCRDGADLMGHPC